MGIKKSFALLGIFLLLLAACGGGGGGGKPKNSCPGTTDLQWITVTPYSADVGVGATKKFTATGYYTDYATYATDKDLTTCATWASADEAIATVSKGTVTGKAVGYYVKITASYGSENDYAYVDVVPTLESITVSPTSAKIMAGETQNFTATGHYDDGSDSSITYSVTWSSSDTGVATMSGRTATGKASGTATITAALSGITNTATLDVVELTSIDVDPVSTEVQETAQRQFTATATYSDSSTGDITDSVLWTTSDEAIAVISNTPGSKGVATGMSIGGPVTITASKSGITSAPASLAVTEKRPDLSVRVTGAISNGTELYVTYTVKNNGLANSTGFDVDVWGDLASPPTIGASGDTAGKHTGLAAGAALDGYVFIPSTLASGAAYAVVDTADSIVESEEDNNVSIGFPWPYSHSCADVVDNLSKGTCDDIDNGFKLTAAEGYSLTFGGYTFYPYSYSDSIGPKNICSLALYGDGGVVREHPQSASTTYDDTLPYEEYWYNSSPCGYADALIDLGTAVDWTSYPAGKDCDGYNTYTVLPTKTLTCTYAAAAGLVAPVSYDFDDGLFPTAFTNSGDAGWYNEGTALRSGAIADSQESCFAVTAAATSGVSFDRSVDSEWSDRLRLYVDGTYVDYYGWYGSVAWGTVDFPQTFGTHEYKWCYWKDSAAGSGAVADAAWVDNISIY